MGVRNSLRRRIPGRTPATVVVREYGRDSLVVWANLLLGPLFAALGIRVGLQSEERLSARIEADAAAMRRRGYLVASVETFSLPVIGAPRSTASWCRVTYERSDSRSG
jgi:hypothetical protein